MYTSFLKDIENSAQAAFTSISGGQGSFVHMRWSDTDDAFNRPKPIIGLYSTSAVPDFIEGFIEYTVGILFIHNDNQDSIPSYTTKALDDSERLYIAFCNDFKSKGYSMANILAEREVKIMNGVLTGWGLTFTTRAAMPC